eukprot:Clim_evm83s236 gene=Clim_evmTU83s236
MAEDPPKFLFDIAWEVANKVGGIYTVIRSKTPVTVSEYEDDYCLIGPYNVNAARTEVESMEPDTEPMRKAVEAMKQAGINVFFGRWLVEGYPRVVLLDLDSYRDRTAKYKSEFWDLANIGTPDHDPETNDAVLFGFGAAMFLRAFEENIDKMVIANFHEWLAGVGLVVLRCWQTQIATIFTTHATLLGRYLCAAANIDFYNNLDKFDCDKEAAQRGIYHRYAIEKAATHSAHTFTTVSQITGDEALALLGRKPDVITPNGLNVKKFAALHEFQNLHAKMKEKIQSFVRGHFYGHNNWDMDKTLYFFIAGRYEYTNKGADFYIDALAELNRLLKEKKSDTTVVAFVIMPAKTNNFNFEALRGQAVTKQLRDTVNDIKGSLGDRLFDATAKGRIPDIDSLITEGDRIRLKRCMYALQRNSLPPIVTHNMTDDNTDQILSHLRGVRLFNDGEDRVKVVFHPEFLSSTSPLFPIDYEEFVRGCHLGVFPSYYEPWGYTPAECTVMGVPSVTSNLSGFGCFISDHVVDPSSYGVYIIDRHFSIRDDALKALGREMFQFTQLSRRQRINLRNRTERLSELLDWKRLGMYYVRARSHSLHKAYPENFAMQLEDDEEFSTEDISRNLAMPRPESAPSSPKVRLGTDVL